MVNTKFLDSAGLSYFYSLLGNTFLKNTDISNWAKEPTKPSYTLDEIPDGEERKITELMMLTEQTDPVSKLGDGTTSDDTHGEIRNATGRTVVWNQLVPISGTDKSKTSNGVTFVDNRDGSYTFYTTEEGATAMTYLSLAVFESPNQLHNHKVLLTGIMGGASNTYSLLDVWSGLTGATNPNIITVSGDSKIVHAIKVASGAIITTPVTVKPQIFDLTQMFGAGNEPSTVDEFEALFPLDYYEYNAGTMLGGTVTGFKSTDSDGNTLSNLSIPITTGPEIISEVMFPYGLNGIANVKDEIDFEHGTAVRRIGVVDLGSLTWTIQPTYGAYATRENNPTFLLKATGVSGGVSKLLANGYVTDSFSKLYSAGVDSKLISGGGSTTSTSVCISLPADKNTNALIQAYLDGVLLYYELETPIEFTLDTVPSTSYKTRKGGKEMWLPAHSSAPTAAPVDWSTTYGMSTVEEIDKKAEVKTYQIPMYGEFTEATIEGTTIYYYDDDTLADAIVNDIDSGNVVYLYDGDGVEYCSEGSGHGLLGYTFSYTYINEGVARKTEFLILSSSSNIEGFGRILLFRDSTFNPNNGALTGIPTAPTAASGTNTTQIATTAFVQGEISSQLGNIETLLAAI